MRGLLKASFWAALVATLWFALYPKPPQILPTDKEQHLLAFFTLSLLAFGAFGTKRWLAIAAAMAALGGAIELLQLIPELHRDADVVDWLYDCAAIAVAAAVMLTARVRILRQTGP
jgi:VanZ family protein